MSRVYIYMLQSIRMTLDKYCFYKYIYIYLSRVILIDCSEVLDKDLLISFT